jgi:hypothetical protein
MLRVFLFHKTRLHQRMRQSAKVLLINLYPFHLSTIPRAREHDHTPAAGFGFQS